MDMGNYTENHHVFIIFIQGRKFLIHRKQKGIMHFKFSYTNIF